MVIRALTVDLDDTLWDIWPVMKRAEQMVLQFAEQNLPPSVVAALADRDAVWGLRTELLAENPQMANNLSLWRVAAYQRTLERVGLPQSEAEETANRLFQVYFQWRNSVDLFAGVEPVLQQMSGTIRLGSLTNGNADLEAIGIDKYFDFCMSSSDVGSRKPEAQIFIAAAEAAGCAPEQVLHPRRPPRARRRWRQTGRHAGTLVQPAGDTLGGQWPAPRAVAPMVRPTRFAATFAESLMLLWMLMRWKNQPRFLELRFKERRSFLCFSVLYMSF